MGLSGHGADSMSIVAGRQSPLPRLPPAKDGHPTTLRHPCHGPTAPIAHHPTLTTGSPPWFAHCPKCTTTGLCLISRSPLPAPSLRATGASSRCCSHRMSVMCPKLGGRQLLTCMLWTGRRRHRHYRSSLDPRRGARRPQHPPRSHRGPEGKVILGSVRQRGSTDFEGWFQEEAQEERAQCRVGCFGHTRPPGRPSRGGPLRRHPRGRAAGGEPAGIHVCSGDTYTHHRWLTQGQSLP